MSRLRVLTIGAGYFAQFHLDAWSRMEEVDLVGLCDSDAAKAEAAAARFGIARTGTEARAMIEALRPDLIDIATPPASHLALIRLAVEAGLPAVCQKAFCRDIAEAEEATALAEAAGTLLVVHENFRFQPWFQEIRRVMDEGRLGDLYGASFRLRPGDGQGPRAYLDRQPYFQSMERLLVHETAIHFIDTFRFLMGEVDALYARLARLNPVIAGEDAGVILFEFASGTRAIFDGNRLSDHIAEDRRRTMGEMWVEGSAGTLRLDGDGGLHLRAFGSNREEPWPYTWENRGFAGDSVLRLQRHVVKHLREGTPLMNRARDYLENLRIEDAVYRSSRLGTREVLR